MLGVLTLMDDSGRKLPREPWDEPDGGGRSAFRSILPELIPDAAGAAEAPELWPDSVADEGGGGGRAAVAWLVIVLCVAVLGPVTWFTSLRSPEPSSEPFVPGMTHVMQTLMLRYMVGLEAVASMSGDASMQADAEQAAREMLGALDEMVATPGDRIGLAIAAGELLGAEAAMAELDRAAMSEPSGPLFEDVQSLRTVYAHGPGALPAAKMNGLVDRYNWLGEVARAFDRPATHAQRRAVVNDALFTVSAVLILMMTILVGGLVGFGLGVYALTRIVRGRLHWRFARTARLAEGPALLESTSWFLAAFLVLSLAAWWFDRMVGGRLMPIVMWLFPLVLLWPMVRGWRWTGWRRAVGLTAPKGVGREMAAGVVGYLAGAPVLAAGLFLTVMLSALIAVVEQLVAGGGGGEGDRVGHPIFYELLDGGGGTVVLAFVMACIWAPIVEELVFRGAMYAHMRRRTGVVLSSLTTGVVFAMIHPTGLAAVPVLTSLAFVFALIREWRGSIIGPMTAHALHNGFVLGVAVSLFA